MIHAHMGQGYLPVLDSCSTRSWCNSRNASRLSTETLPKCPVCHFSPSQDHRQLVCIHIRKQMNTLADCRRLLSRRRLIQQKKQHVLHPDHRVQLDPPRQWIVPYRRPQPFHPLENIWLRGYNGRWLWHDLLHHHDFD